MEALMLANRVRLVRAQVRRAVEAMPRREGRLKVAEILHNLEDHPDLYGWECRHLLCALPRVGEQRARRALSAVGASWRRELGELTPRQVHELEEDVVGDSGRLWSR
jgi:hypothetical protein